MPEQYKVEGEMLASKVNEALNSLRNSLRAANPAKCDIFEEEMMEALSVTGFGSSMGYFVEKVHAVWPSAESAKMKFPSPGCLHLTPAGMTPQDIAHFLKKVGELTFDEDGHLTGPYIYWSWAQHDWLRPEGNFSKIIEVTDLDPVTMPCDWCVIFCGTTLTLHLWGGK